MLESDENIELKEAVSWQYIINVYYYIRVCRGSMYLCIVIF